MRSLGFYGDESVQHSAVYDRSIRFQNGKELLEDEECSVGQQRQFGCAALATCSFHTQSLLQIVSEFWGSCDHPTHIGCFVVQAESRVGVFFLPAHWTRRCPIVLGWSLVQLHGGPAPFLPGARVRWLCLRARKRKRKWISVGTVYYRFQGMWRSHRNNATCYKRNTVNTIGIICLIWQHVSTLEWYPSGQ